MEMRKLILIVDDEEPILFVLHRALTRLEKDFEVETAETVEDALEKIQESSFDLIITDLIMPEMSGVEFTEKILELDPRPVVMWMTAYHCQSFRDEAERLGVFHCIEKPLEIGPFRELVQKAMTPDA